MDSNLSQTIVIHHTSNNRTYLGHDLASLQAIIGNGINVLDVVLLVYVYLSYGHPRGEFSEEFASLYRNLPTNGPTRDQHMAANCIYFGVKQYLKSVIGNPVSTLLPSFIIKQYVFGTNKQTLAVAVQRIRLPTPCSCFERGNRII